jgi:ribonuclease P protein component
MPSLRLRFPKSARLSQAAEFARLRRDGRSFHGKLVVLSVLKAEPDMDTRIGLITSRRVGGAVVRNRVRRRLREIVRAVLPRMSRGLLIVLVARAAAANADFADLRADVLALVQRSVILRPECS